MKPYPLSPLCFLLSLGASSLGAQITPPTDATARAWTHGFEAAEGYQAGQTATGEYVAVTGGTATILTAGAAEGAQFLRFVPRGADDALMINLPDKVAAGDDRSVTFAVRLAEGAKTTRLALAQGWTVALKPVAGGLEIETAEIPPRRVSLALAAGEWLVLGLREHGTAGTWDLLVAGHPAFTGLPLESTPETLANLLIFADGALDLDAIALTAGADESAGEESASPDISTPGGNSSATLTSRERSDQIALALAAAKKGDLSLALVTARKLAGRNQDPAAQGLEAAQLLASMAFALRDGGLHQPAAELGRLALQHLQQVRTAAAKKPGSAGLRTTCEFVAAQINEQLLGDEAEAGRLFRKTLEFMPGHQGAQGGEQRLALQRERAAKGRAFAEKGILTGSDQGPSTGSGQGGGK